MKTPPREDGVKTYYAPDRAAWRAWLAEHHATEKSVWLIIYRKKSNTPSGVPPNGPSPRWVPPSGMPPSVYYDEAVDEALCFGWIDSKPNKRDEQSYYQYFSPRNPKSNWSQINKEKVRRLTAENRMAPAGLAMVKLAKETSTWTALEDVDNLVVPPDLQEALDQNPTAYEYWQQFPPSTRRGILEWIFSAKRPETRHRRIEKTVQQAAQNIRANY